MERDGSPGLDAVELLEMLRAVPEGMARLARDGCVRYLNPAGEDILGLDPEEWSGRNLLEVLRIYGDAGQTDPLDLAAVLDHLATGRTWGREDAWIVGADGRQIPAAYVFAPVLTGKGLEGAVLVFRDLTDRRRAERTLQEARVELAAAGKAEAAKAAFLSAVSRDVLGPVDVLVGAAERLAAAELPPALREEAETVRASSRALLGVLGDVLDWTRIETGDLELQTLEFDLRAALGDVIESARPAAAAKGVTLELRLESEGVGNVVGDPGRVRQITDRILAYAIRATENGPVVTTLQTSGKSRSDVMVRIRVDHAGPSAVEAVRGPAREGAMAVALPPTGPRSALTLAARLVQRLGGVLDGESRGDGTSTTWFEMRLPLGRAGSRDLRAADLRGVRALILDSSETGRETLTSQLAAAGLRCTTTGSGGQALRLLRSALAEWDPYRIAVLSAPLREMDAATLGDLVKGDPRLRETALVFLASVGEPGDARRLESIGFAAYLVKPVSADMLRDALSVVWGAALVRAEIPLVTRHVLRDSRLVRLTPAEIRDRSLRPPHDAEGPVPGEAARPLR